MALPSKGVACPWCHYMLHLLYVSNASVNVVLEPWEDDEYRDKYGVNTKLTRSKFGVCHPPRSWCRILLYPVFDVIQIMA